MDRRVKERLVGASILVALLVLIVPELLSGPKPSAIPPRLPLSAPEPVRTVTVDLATRKPPAPDSGAEEASGAGAARAADDPAREEGGTPVLPPPAPPPAPAPAPPPAASAAARESPAPPRPVETAAPPKSVPGQAWAVQLGSFASRDNADKLVHQLKSEGYPVYVLSSGAGASQRYRVRIGPLADRGAAAASLERLKALGHAASLVPPAG